jgi:L-threonylcarbamoyladenylate synthase
MSQTYNTSLLFGEDSVSQAVSLLQKGECVALPTETVYGLAAVASDIIAVNKIFEAKGRPKNHPLIVHVPDVSHLENWAKSIPKRAYDFKLNRPPIIKSNKKNNLTSRKKCSTNTVKLLWVA